jgi:toxin ParE1/3/4
MYYVVIHRILKRGKAYNKWLTDPKHLASFLCSRALSKKVPGELEDSRYREVIVGPCRVFYRVEGDIVFVLFVMRSERALRNFILEYRAKGS